MSAWLKWFGTVLGTRLKPRRPTGRPWRRRLEAEPLEDRILLNAYDVTRIADDANANSLRWAIQQANGRAGMDEIVFKINGQENTIAPMSDLPAITDPVTIKIETGAGFEGQRIILDGGGLGARGPPSRLKTRPAEAGLRGRTG